MTSDTSSFPQLEREILEFWERERCFQRLVEANRGKPSWSFLDGPITANNPMGVHHAWGRTYKDLYQRFHAMTGHELRYQNGFDCQGLWVEVEVEKELGFKSKRDIEAYGIGPFVERCKERVRKFAAIQTEQSKRLGYWMDWENSYFTMADENNYTIWQFLKRCHERGFVYHGYDAMPWCPRCGTGISQHEISNEERPEVVHRSPIVKLPLHGRPGEFLLIWTTTPWTLTSNVACAVHPDLSYLRIRQGGEVYYLAKDRLEAVTRGKGSVEILEELPGSRLVGWTYDGPFDELAAQQPEAHRVVPWKEVTTSDGTGLVHIAPGCGKEDYELGKELGLPAIGPIDEFGLFVEGFGPYTGEAAASVSPAIHRSLQEKGLLYRTEDYKHAYPICWRCKTQLLFRLVDEWYIRMDELRHEIIAVTEKTRWIPEVGCKLEIEWLNNMHDWMISKKRYWGLALPIYRCPHCDTFEVVGGREELKQRAVEGWEQFDGNSPHRPWVDAVKIACPNCGASISRIPDVGNPWLDAGIVPYSTMRYNSDRDYWRRWFPADWISESFPGQFRNWFYAILAMSTVMENRPPFKLMFGYRLMKDEKGEEMHKSKGNSVEFNQAAEQEGADAMRWLYASHNPEQDLWFGYGKIHDARRQFLVLWNVYEFFLTYSRIDGFVPPRQPLRLEERSEMDRWILYHLEQLVESAHRNYGDYAVHLFLRDVVSFIDALSRWYLRRSRRRFWKTTDDGDKRAAYETLWECLVISVKLLAPVIPFTTEAMYQELVRGAQPDEPISVHLCDFPVPGGVVVDSSLLESMDAVRDLVEVAQAARSKAGIKVRQPLAELRVECGARGPAERLLPLLDLISQEVNVKRVHLEETLAPLYEVQVRLDAKTGKPKYGRHYQELDEALRASDPAQLEAAVRAGSPFRISIEGEPTEVEASEIKIARQGRGDWEIAEGNGFIVALDRAVDETLEKEGMVRDLVRQIQSLRKERQLEVTDRIRLYISADERSAALVASQSGYIAEETLATEVRHDGGPRETAREVSLGADRIWIDLEKA